MDLSNIWPYAPKNRVYHGYHPQNEGKCPRIFLMICYLKKEINFIIMNESMQYLKPKIENKLIVWKHL
jgi:hypothetical protein